MSRDVAGQDEDVLRVHQTRDQTRRFYNKISRVYDLLAERTEAPVRRVGRELLAPAPGERVLEVGFGTGHSLVELSEAVGERGRVVGIDLAEGMIAEARKVLRRAGAADRVWLTGGDALRLPFRAASFHAAFLSFTLELFDTPDIPRVLGELRRVLVAGGRLAVVAMSKAGSPGLLVHAFEWSHEHFPTFVDCRPIYVARALRADGFEVREEERRRLWVPVEVVLGVSPGEG